MALKLEELLVAAGLNAEAIIHIKQYVTGEKVLKDHQITANDFLSGLVPTSAIGTDIGMLVQLVDNGGAALPAVSGVNLTNVDVGTGNASTKGSVKLSDSTGSTQDVSQGVAATPKAVKIVADQLSTKLSEGSTPTLTETWTFQETINAPGIVDDTTVTIESTTADVDIRATAGIIRTEDALALASITYNSIASLNSALVTALITPTKGMWAFVEGQGIVWYNGSAWVAIYSYINTSGFVTEVGNWTFAGNVTFSNPLTVAAASANGHAANLGQVLAAIDAISVVNVGTGSSVIKSFNTTTDTISLRSIKSGTGISVNTVGDEIVISATAFTEATLPPDSAGVLTNDGAGVLTWETPTGGITAGDSVLGQDSVTTELDLEIGQTTAEDIFSGIVKPLLLNKPATDLKTVIGGVFDAFGILGAVLGCVHNIARTGATRVVNGIIGDNAGTPSFLANAQFDHDGTTGLSTAQFIANGISVTLREDGTGESIFDISAANSARLASYANLTAINAAIGTPQSGMIVRVIGQGLATYTGTAWVKASDDTTPIT